MAHFIQILSPSEVMCDGVILSRSGLVKLINEFRYTPCNSFGASSKCELVAILRYMLSSPWYSSSRRKHGIKRVVQLEFDFNN